MDRLFLVEGIPGSGKTTFAKLLAEKLSGFGENVKVYTEGDLHPADMAWCALLTEAEFEAVCNKYPDNAAAFEANGTRWENYRIVAYTKVEGLSGEAFAYFESKEVYDGRVSSELFRRVHQSRWESYGRESAGLTVFECAFMQNAVNELLLFNNAGKDEISSYLISLAKAVERLKPTVIYLDVDVAKSLENAAAQRVDENGSRVWESCVAEYISASPYGKKHALKGTAGIRRYFEARKALELQILPELPVEKRIVKIDFSDRESCVEKAIGEIAASLE